MRDKCTWFARAKNKVKIKIQIRISFGLLIHEVKDSNEKGMMLQHAIFLFPFKAKGVFGSFVSRRDCDELNPYSNSQCPNAALGLKRGPVSRKRCRTIVLSVARGSEAKDTSEPGITSSQKLGYLAKRD
ncbi:hypothetical protein VNO77_40498 [Canavalia gladiata]|uniref:Uncharacterized protein n=1 Tax=Canavalia gladiata TaxID=3824 RepID=A0AAN9JYF7_CANGL